MSFLLVIINKGLTWENTGDWKLNPNKCWANKSEKTKANYDENFLCFVVFVVLWSVSIVIYLIEGHNIKKCYFKFDFSLNLISKYLSFSLHNLHSRIRYLVISSQILKPRYCKKCLSDCLTDVRKCHMIRLKISVYLLIFAKILR